MPARVLASEQPVEVTVQEGPAAAAKKRRPRVRAEFPPFSTVRAGTLYDLRLYDVRPMIPCVTSLSTGCALGQNNVRA